MHYVEYCYDTGNSINLPPMAEWPVRPGSGESSYPLIIITIYLFLSNFYKMLIFEILQ